MSYERLIFVKVYWLLMIAGGNTTGIAFYKYLPAGAVEFWLHQ